MTAEEIITDLHDSEINGQIAWFYDGTWTAVIGSDLNGWEIEETLGSFAEAIEWLRAEAVRRYPNSGFAKKHARGFC
jgi:hypothetical protein